MGKSQILGRFFAALCFAAVFVALPTTAQPLPASETGSQTRGNQSDTEQLLAQELISKHDWQRLAESYNLNGQEREAFEVRKLMYLAGMLEGEVELLELANSYRQFGAPYHGARVLEKAINAGRVDKTVQNLTMLADFYRLSREDESTARVLEEVVQTGGGAEIYDWLGATYFEMQMWTEAETATLGAVNAGLGEPDFSRAWVRIGQARFERGDRYCATLAFRKAKNEAGRRWLEYLQAAFQWTGPSFELVSQVRILENEAQICRRKLELTEEEIPDGCGTVAERLERAREDLRPYDCQ